MATDKHTMLAKQREHRKLTGNAATKKYEKTPKGFLMRAYRNMESRVRGIQKQKYHLYSGLSISIARDDFYSWAMSCDKFRSLFAAWREAGYKQKLTPSVDRVDSSRGYEFENIEWVTHSENSRRGAVSRHSRASNAYFRGRPV